MRLTNYEIFVIKTQVALIFGSNAKVYLFGSRIFDSKKGGDIDLLIVTAENTIYSREKTNLLNVNLILALGDQKIDILVNRTHTKQAIYQTALQTGILL